jgi:meso-butanediol dehydrogenase / (S,S)-butanediol dehydrogenase / diacetyl reductase
VIAWATYPYKGTVVLVTGAGTGIGRSIARAFLEQGASVAVIGRTEAALREAVVDFEEDRILVLSSDLTDDGAVDASVAAVIAKFGRLDVVIANAGTSEASNVDTFDGAAWKRIRSVNLDAMIALVRATTPLLRASRGNFIAISSVSGLRGEWGMYAYNATKAAVNVMMQSLALDLGRAGVRVNAIAPGFTVSRLTQARLDDAAFTEKLMDRVALDRVASPDDIARVTLFVASPDAGYLTGAIIPVDGGISASAGTPRPA